jgi:hypothetical protein
MFPAIDKPSITTAPGHWQRSIFDYPTDRPGPGHSKVRYFDEGERWQYALPDDLAQLSWLCSATMIVSML